MIGGRFCRHAPQGLIVPGEVAEDLIRGVTGIGSVSTLSIGASSVWTRGAEPGITEAESAWFCTMFLCPTQLWAARVCQRPRPRDTLRVQGAQGIVSTAQNDAFDTANRIRCAKGIVSAAQYHAFDTAFRVR